MCPSSILSVHCSSLSPPWLESRTLALVSLTGSQKLRNECKDPRLPPHHSCCVAYGNSLPSGPLFPEVWKWLVLEQMARDAANPAGPWADLVSWDIQRTALILPCQYSSGKAQRTNSLRDWGEIMELEFSLLKDVRDMCGLSWQLSW